MYGWKTPAAHPLYDKDVRKRNVVWRKKTIRERSSEPRLGYGGVRHRYLQERPFVETKVVPEAWLDVHHVGVARVLLFKSEDEVR